MITDAVRALDNVLADNSRLAALFGSAHVNARAKAADLLVRYEVAPEFLSDRATVVVLAALADSYAARDAGLARPGMSRRAEAAFLRTTSERTFEGHSPRVPAAAEVGLTQVLDLDEATRAEYSLRLTKVVDERLLAEVRAGMGTTGDAPRTFGIRVLDVAGPKLAFIENMLATIDAAPSAELAKAAEELRKVADKTKDLRSRYDLTLPSAWVQTTDGHRDVMVCADSFLAMFGPQAAEAERLIRYELAHADTPDLTVTPGGVGRILEEVHADLRGGAAGYDDATRLVSLAATQAGRDLNGLYEGYPSRTDRADILLRLHEGLGPRGLLELVALPTETKLAGSRAAATHSLLGGLDGVEARLPIHARAFSQAQTGESETHAGSQHPRPTNLLGRVRSALSAAHER